MDKQNFLFIDTYMRMLNCEISIIYKSKIETQQKKSFNECVSSFKFNFLMEW